MKKRLVLSIICEKYCLRIPIKNCHRRHILPNKCGLHTWFIAADMQFHWISLIVMIALHQRFNKCLIWASILVSYIFILYDSMFWAYGQTYGQTFTPAMSALLYPLKKVLWALNLTAIIWMCITGNATFINRFLSYKAFIPLSRLTYSVYLTHAWIVWIYWGSKRDLIDMKNFTILSLTSSVILISFCMSIVFSMLFEAPFFALQGQSLNASNNNNDSHEMDVNY
ncbi:unnamed protein product [Medioppia subpectinata]|uniref:Acyltransferase 3 domain-containing protein n=1 Tax=Medioppia subpectinata TaxID=1979941 RepID=A0A7R9PWS1_9ACAR|nr:unnamed protein product [Medioppia subpectinata]CAG2104089.1 unnamed protein product [Medioppia subpectinata]